MWYHPIYERQLNWDVMSDEEKRLWVIVLREEFAFFTGKTSRDYFNGKQSNKSPKKEKWGEAMRKSFNDNLYKKITVY